MVCPRKVSQNTLIYSERFIFCLLGAVTISGLAGVLLEFVFKKEEESTWVDNFYLALFSAPAALYAAIVERRESSFTLLFLPFLR